MSFEDAAIAEASADWFVARDATKRLCGRESYSRENVTLAYMDGLQAGREEATRRTVEACAEVVREYSSGEIGDAVVARLQALAPTSGERAADG